MDVIEYHIHATIERCRGGAWLGMAQKAVHFNADTLQQGIKAVILLDFGKERKQFDK